MLTIYMYQIRSSIFDTTDFSEERVSISSMVSSNNETDEVDYARPRRSSLGKIRDSKLYLSENEEITINNDKTVDNNEQTAKKETIGNNEKQMSLHQRDFALSTDFEAKSQEHFAKLSHLDYFIDDQNG